jgi:hypothetical protein
MIMCFCFTLTFIILNLVYPGFFFSETGVYVGMICCNGNMQSISRINNMNLFVYRPILRVFI